MQPPTSLSAAGDTVFCELAGGNLRDEGSNCGLKLLLSYQGMVEQSLAFPNKSTPPFLVPPGIMGRREGGGGGEDDSADIKQGTLPTSTFFLATDLDTLVQKSNGKIPSSLASLVYTG